MTSATMTAPIPATVVTGFLGAGKTTLIRNLLENAGGKRIALIVNEFGDVGFDGGFLSSCGIEGCSDGDVVELANGCICCTVADEFLPAMEAILSRGPAPDHIVIETSGLALPQPLVRAFAWPGIAGRVTVDGVVTVVDAEAVAAGRVVGNLAELEAQRRADEALDHESPIEELFEDQLRCADLVVLSKTDLVDRRDVEAVASRVGEETRPGVKAIQAVAGDLPAHTLLGLGVRAEADMRGRESHHDLEGEDHDHDDFASFVAEAGAPSREEAEARVRRALQLSGVLRIKGGMRVDGKSAALVVQGVGPRVEAWFDAGQEAGLVVIGLKDMDEAEIRHALRNG